MCLRIFYQAQSLFRRQECNYDWQGIRQTESHISCTIRPRRNVLRPLEGEPSEDSVGISYCFEFKMSSWTDFAKPKIEDSISCLDLICLLF